MKKVLNAIVDVLIILLFGVSLLVVTMSLTSRSTGMPNIGGYTLFSVQTDSMEPTIMTGDLMISKLSDSNATYKIGDVVTFRMFVDRTLILNTHRIVEIKEIDGVTYYTTKGDNAAGEDRQDHVAGDIVAVWGGVKLGGLGKAMDFLQTKKGFFFCVLLPMIVFFGVVLFQFIKNLIEYNKARAKEEAASTVAELTEEQKKKAIEEYLAAQNKGDGDSPN